MFLVISILLFIINKSIRIPHDITITIIHIYFIKSFNFEHFIYVYALDVCRNKYSDHYNYLEIIIFLHEKLC